MADLDLQVFLRSLPEVPSEEGPIDVGFQVKAGTITPGRDDPKIGLVFKATVGVVEKDKAIDFRGPVVQGRPGKRFVYLSWKRKGVAGPSWFQRVKIPLEGLTANFVHRALAGSGTVQADVTGRRPHETTPVEWTLLTD